METPETQEVRAETRVLLTADIIPDRMVVTAVAAPALAVATVLMAAVVATAPTAAAVIVPRAAAAVIAPARVQDHPLGRASPTKCLLA